MASLRILAIAFSVCLAAGCIHDHQSHHNNGNGSVEVDEGTSYGIPPSAHAVAETKGGKLDFGVPTDGKVYLADDSARVVIWDGHVRGGDRVYVNPDKNRIELNGKEQARIDLKSNHRFVLFFERR